MLVWLCTHRAIVKPEAQQALGKFAQEGAYQRQTG